jgi:hypothetical protein
MSYVVLLLAAGVTIYALVDCWSSSPDEVRGLPRLAWLLLIVFLPPVGGIGYLLVGRTGAEEPQLSRPRVVAPDDDPDFLRQLDQQRRRAAAEERRREAQLRKEREKDRKDREKAEKAERQHRKERLGDHDGEDHTEHPTG